MIVAILIPTENVHAHEVAGMSDTLMEANRQLGREAYRVRVLAERGGPVVCASGLRVVPDATVSDFDEPADTVILAGTYGPPSPPSDAVVEWIRKQAIATRRFGSVCTGAFLLGAAGLLDGRRVTTHWEYAAALAAAFPRAIVETDRIFVRDGAMFSAAGSIAALDATLSLIEEDFGASHSLAVARRMLLFLKRPGGQLQYSAHLAEQVGVLSPIGRTQRWIGDHLRADLSVPALAGQAAMSRRNFARAFVQETGMTPGDFVELARIDAARVLLDSTEMPVQRIASQSGFASPQAMRRAFVRRLGLTPSDYRSRFRSTQ